MILWKSALDQRDTFIITRWQNIRQTHRCYSKDMGKVFRSNEMEIANRKKSKWIVVFFSKRYVKMYQLRILYHVYVTLTVRNTTATYL